MDYHKSVSDALTANQVLLPQLSLQQLISKKLDEYSADYHTLLFKVDKLSSNTFVEDTNTISSALSSVINEEIEKSKCKLNPIIHNLTESSKESGDA